MSKYKATFTTTAEVVIEFDIEATNQQDGLVLAHDHIHQVALSQARVVRIDLDKALNTAFERVATATAELPLSPLELSGKCSVQFFMGQQPSGTPVVDTHLPSFEAAKRLAESVLAEDSAYGSSRVVDEMGVPVMKAQAPRGGWEVEGIGADGQCVVRSTWLVSQSAAKTDMFAVLARAGIAYVRVLDYTDRARGPVLWKEIR